MHRNWLLYVFVACFGAFGAAFAVELTGSMFVNESSDTAASAKNKAFNVAQRAVILRELRNYADSAQLEEALKNTDGEELMNLISSSSVSSEKISDTTYSANISFVIDAEAARDWLNANSVQHWLPGAGDSTVAAPVNSVLVNATLVRPISDWMNLNAVSRSAGVDLLVRSIVGNRVSFVVLDKDVSRFSGELRAAGWQVYQVGDGFRIWK